MFMYVCNCNGFTDRDVRRAICESGTRSVAAVYRQLDCRPLCGKCKPMLRELVDAASQPGRSRGLARAAIRKVMS
jgi:bacterioferritin-associated ferredoxin